MSLPVNAETGALVGAWLATYLVHGLGLFAAALLIERWTRSARMREQLWRAALFGPLLTASLQLGAGIDPVGGRWTMPEASAPETTEVVELEVVPDAATARPDRYSARVLPRRAITRPVSVAPPVVPQVMESEAAAPRPWTLGALIAVALGIAVLMARALLEALRMNALGKGTPLRSGKVVELVSGLRRRAGLRRNVRVFTTKRGSSPYATGVFAPSIVVPERAIAEFDARTMEAMLAHELGHVARLDPLWTAATRSVTALFFFQPLNWLAARRLDECSEFSCDEFAIQSTGDEVALARCLTTVADWIVGQNGLQPACPMAHRRSPLAERVERILETEGQVGRSRRRMALIAPTAILGTAIAAPGFATVEPPLDAVPAGLSALAPADATGTLPAPVAPAEMTLADELALLLASFELDIVQIEAEVVHLIELGATRELDGTTKARLAALRQQAATLRSMVQIATETARGRARN